MTRALLVALLIATPCLAFARDFGQWAQSSPEIRDWIRGLKNKKGVPCCDTADGEEPEMYDNDGGKWRVRIKGTWTDVPPEALLDDIPNKLGYARVWVRYFDGKPQIICFIPGALL